MAAQPTPPAPSGQNIAQTLGQTLGHIMPTITNIHAWFWALVVTTIGVHMLAGAAAIVFGDFGKLAMLFIEMAWMIIIWVFATHPAIIAAEIAASAFAAAGSGTFGDSSRDIIGGWLKKITSINAYIIGIPVTAMLLLDIKEGGVLMLMLLFIGIVLSMITMTTNPDSKFALNLAQAGLVGSCVKIALSLIAKTEGSGAEVWIINTLKEEATLIGIVVALGMLFGSEKLQNWIIWFWNNVVLSIFGWLHPKTVLRFLGGAVVLGSVLFFVYWFLNPISATQMWNEKLETIERVTSTNSSSSSSSSQSNSSTEQVTSPQLPIDESQWKKVGEKTCEVAWNNKDFKDGWCLIGNFEPGEYRFKVRSGLRNKQPTGSDLIFPPEGLPTSDWKNSNNQTFADFFEEHSILKNKMVGMIIFRSGEEFPVAGWEMTLDQKESISMSINSRPAEASWKATRFYGKITAQVFKKKT